MLAFFLGMFALEAILAVTDFWQYLAFCERIGQAPIEVWHYVRYSFTSIGLTIKMIIVAPYVAVLVLVLVFYKPVHAH